MWLKNGGKNTGKKTPIQEFFIETFHVYWTGRYRWHRPMYSVLLASFANFMITCFSFLIPVQSILTTTTFIYSSFQSHLLYVRETVLWTQCWNLYILVQKYEKRRVFFYRGLTTLTNKVVYLRCITDSNVNFNFNAFDDRGIVKLRC